MNSIYVLIAINLISQFKKNNVVAFPKKVNNFKILFNDFKFFVYFDSFLDLIDFMRFQL